MSLTWREAPEPGFAPPGPAGWLRAGARGLPLVILLVLGLGLSVLLGSGERILGPRRPVSPWVAVVVCRGAMRILGLRTRVEGEPMRRPGAMVANHSSWLDIFALNAQARMTFVSKAEVAGWLGIGQVARAAGTLFIRRESRAEAAEQARAVARRMAGGETLLFFPEGTSTDGRRVLPFKPALFASLLVPGLPEGLALQPVTVAWDAPDGEDPRFHAWWGGMEFGPHALAVLAARRTGGVRITFHEPIPVAGRDRKSLAAEAEAAVRSAL